MFGRIIAIALFLIIFITVLLHQRDFSISGPCEGNFTATVSRVIDGDTLVVDECSEHIRLALANTPEKDQNGWTEATAFTSKLCKVGSSVNIRQDEGQPYDVYGRIVALVYCQNKILNEELIKNNLAVISTQYCSRSIFATENWAWNNGCNINEN